jgi:hypothetical protein
LEKVSERIAVEQGWFYAEGEGSVGPVSFDALTSALRRLPDPGTTLVWRSGFEDWRAAQDVPELAKRLFARAPEVVTLDPRMDRWSTVDAQSDDWDDDGLPAAPRRRRWPYVAAIVVVAAIVGGGVLYASRTAFAPGEPEGRVVLPAASTSEPPKQEVARTDPATILTQLTETAAQASAATESLSMKLWAAIEPPDMQMPDFASASRGDLEKYVGELKTAEANVTDAYNKYTALLKAEKDLIEEATQSSGLDEKTRTEFLTQVTDRQNASLELITSMLKARLDLYRANQRLQAIAIEQKSKRGGETGRMSKAANERFAAAAAEVNEASKRLDLAEERIIQSRPAPQQGWQNMLNAPGLSATPRQ